VIQEVEISESTVDRRLLDEDRSLRGETELRLTNVDFTDDGRYVCQLSNELGSFEQPVDLRVIGTSLPTNVTTQTRQFLHVVV